MRARVVTMYEELVSGKANSVRVRASHSTMCSALCTFSTPTALAIKSCDVLDVKSVSSSTPAPLRRQLACYACTIPGAVISLEVYSFSCQYIIDRTALPILLFAMLSRLCTASHTTRNDLCIPPCMTLSAGYAVVRAFPFGGSAGPRPGGRFHHQSAPHRGIVRAEEDVDASRDEVRVR